MKKFNWDEEKNRQLKEKRGVSFEDILQTIDDGQLLDIIKNPNLESKNEKEIFGRLTKWILCI